jgi:hypothetical protein
MQNALPQRSLSLPAHQSTAGGHSLFESVMGRPFHEQNLGCLRDGTDIGWLAQPGGFDCYWRERFDHALKTFL